jgi:acetyl esterase/lipase
VGAGGGWPATVQDVAAALDALPDLPEAGRLDLAALAVIGHSAGGHLAAWAAGRHRLPPGAPGAGPRVRVTAAVLQAGVLDLRLAVEQRLGHDAVRAFLGDPEVVPDRYALADPVRLVPTRADVLCVHGAADEDVPPAHSERYAAAARAAGDAVEVRILPGEHMVLVAPSGEPWRLARAWLRARHPTAPRRSTLDL